MKTSTLNTAQIPTVTPAYDGRDRNAWIFGWNPQQELWNGRLAMLGFVAYLFWDWAGYSVLRDVLHLIH
ncbi:chlorophyll a/b-binding protein [Leptolyngbya sp. FACHB-16]|uniref:chlorophyll a/b-binding protein n=1 Tax=unclassified Leptolyngbya TaxID=2650499 RepID=UPI0016898675|nr:chlorophyll a/b-binding protein [Leptolyngbya sp. FACHB-16]MBD2157683.1 high light inducible protein [Leptolyngbya sp. FACHB-16]